MIVVERAISLIQPWATLMAIDAKRVETRSWSTNFRGWVAIHSSKGFPMECRALCYRMPFAKALGGEFNTPADLPLGQILAVAEIIGCKQTRHIKNSLTDQELAFGDYSLGRYAIFTAGVRRLKQPITIRGALSIWRLPAPLLEGHDF